MKNISIQPLWLTYFIEILLVLEFQLTKTYFGTFSYKAHFRPQISSNGVNDVEVFTLLPYSSGNALMSHANETNKLWHERFGHLNFKYLQQLQKNSMVEGLSITLEEIWGLKWAL